MGRGASESRRRWKARRRRGAGGRPEVDQLDPDCVPVWAPKSPNGRTRGDFFGGAGRRQVDEVDSVARVREAAGLPLDRARKVSKVAPRGETFRLRREIRG